MPPKRINKWQKIICWRYTYKTITKATTMWDWLSLLLFLKLDQYTSSGAQLPSGK